MNYKFIKILFVYALNRPFIIRDLGIINKYFDVKILNLSVYEGSSIKEIIYGPFIIFNIIKYLLWADIAYVWFADKHSFLVVFFSKILRKKTIVVVGGYEVMKIPEIRYGGMLTSFKSVIINYILTNASKILAVSNDNMNHILKVVNRKIDLIYNGIDCNEYLPKQDKDKIVITVASLSKNTIRLKGIMTFINCAKILSKIPFLIIGKIGSDIEFLKTNAPPNVKFLGFSKHPLTYYQKAKVYCQLSYYESFGVALAEAMACGCIPVVTDRGALPEVVANCGYIVPYGDVKKTVKAIKNALNSPFKIDTKARYRITRYFSIMNREVLIIEQILHLFYNNVGCNPN